jgi:hypothetical protein
MDQEEIEQDAFDGQQVRTHYVVGAGLPGLPVEGEI